MLPTIPKSQVKIYDAYINDKKLKDFKSNKDLNELTEIIGIWSAYMGWKIESNELNFINISIRKSFPNFTIVDLKQVIEMISRDEIKTPYRGTFAMLYIGQVLAEYNRSKGAIIWSVRNQITKIKYQLPLPKPSLEESTRIQKQIFINAHIDAIKGIFIDSGNLIYNYLLKHKLIDFSKEGIVEAEAYAKKQMEIKRKSSVIQSVIHNSPFKKSNSKKKAQLLKREYAVNKWLRSMSQKEFKKFINTLKID